MKGKDFAIGAAVGVLAGAIAGILFAPQSGKETREDIKEFYIKVKDEIAEELKKASDFTKDTYNKVVKNVVNKYKDAKEITEDQAVEAIDKLEAGFDKIKAQIAKK